MVQNHRVGMICIYRAYPKVRHRATQPVYDDYPTLDEAALMQRRDLLQSSVTVTAIAFMGSAFSRQSRMRSRGAFSFGKVKLDVPFPASTQSVDFPNLQRESSLGVVEKDRSMMPINGCRGLAAVMRQGLLRRQIFDVLAWPLPRLCPIDASTALPLRNCPNFGAVSTAVT